MTHEQEISIVDPYWKKTPDDILVEYAVDKNSGLSDLAIAERLNQYGKNILKQVQKTVWLKILIDQFKSPLILILIIAGIITALISHTEDSIFIFIAVIANVILGFYQEYKADRAVASLAKYLKTFSKVVRNGLEISIDTELIVPGDVICLKPGDRVPADGKLIYTNDLQIDESVITGESLPQVKTVGVDEIDSALGDRVTVVYAGTLVMQGSAVYIAVTTGSSTEFGQIAGILDKELEEETPLQKKIKKFSIQISIILGLMTVMVFIIGIFNGYTVTDMFLTSLALAVSAIPESLPIAMTVILAIGVERMAKRKGIVKRLVAAETLGDTTLILTDKTGTLTKAQMELIAMYKYEAHQTSPLSIISYDDPEYAQFIDRAVVNSSVSIENPDAKPEHWIMDGKIMEVSLIRGLAKQGISLQKMQDKQSVMQSLPFNAVHKFSVSLIKHPVDQSYELVFYGAPDILINFLSISDEEKQVLNTQIDAMAHEGNRLLGIAHKSITELKDVSQLHNVYETGLTLDGLISFKDPIREGVKESIETISLAGIKTVIMTGDHQGTATAVAKELGIWSEGVVLDASELRTMSDSLLAERLKNTRIISRVTPFDKQKIVKLYQSLGEVVAMTGDGINDAPAIKSADVGIAMGSGTEVSRNVADLVLLDDNFETIVSAVEEGRQIMKNIKKALVYLLSNMADGILLIGGAVIVGLPLPLSAVQMLWVNFFSDSFPALAFAFEKEDRIFLSGTVKREKGLFDAVSKFLVIVIGTLTSALLFALYVILINKGFEKVLVQTFIFASFGTYTLFLALSVRSLQKSIFTYSFFSNPAMLIGVGIGFLLMVCAIYVPGLQRILGTVPLSLPWIIGVLLVGMVNISLVEITKAVFRRRHA